jgi:hypothetical protein
MSTLHSIEILPLYTHPQETWTVAQCEAAAKRISRDGLGTVGGPRGLIAHTGSPYCQYGGTVRWNGCTEREGKLYRAEHKPLPKIPPGFHFETAVSWGIRIVKDNP